MQVERFESGGNQEDEEFKTYDKKENGYWSSNRSDDFFSPFVLLVFFVREYVLHSTRNILSNGYDLRTLYASLRKKKKEK